MSFGHTIIEWYKEHHRSLPWRETKDPYRIWVSEVILQQTRVNQGLEYYRRFLEQFPDIQALARAPEEKVLKAWQGLGYYSRARNMHKAARTIVDELSGRFPTNYRELLGLQGIGEYTASAVASIAFDLPYPVMDGNVLRFMARLFGITQPVNGAAGKKVIHEYLSREIAGHEPGLFNQAAMEFGAMLCTPKNPVCLQCPLQSACVARNTGHVDKIPVKDKKPLPQPRYFHYLVIILKEDNQIFTFLNKRSEKDIWRNLYEFPMIEAQALLNWDELRKQQRYREVFPESQPRLAGVSNDFTHVLSHRILYARCFMVIADRAPENLIKARQNEIDHYPLPRLMEKMLENINITFYVKKD
jgi:A/G-specific adenine glycosylase